MILVSNYLNLLCSDLNLGHIRLGSTWVRLVQVHRYDLVACCKYLQHTSLSCTRHGSSAYVEVEAMQFLYSSVIGEVKVTVMLCMVRGSMHQSPMLQGAAFT